MKIIQIVGARPQFIKYFPVLKSIEKHKENGKDIGNLLIHTGQHYDHGMSKIFFEQLNIPEPAINLGVGSGPHGYQTGQMLKGVEEILIIEKPDWVIVYGDTNSTLAGALTAAKMHIPVAHIEAGLRSFNKKMPEEINRILTDHVSDLLFCPTNNAVECLAAEGIVKGVFLVGDVMYDALIHFFQRAKKESNILQHLGVEPKQYILMTLHRPANTDSPEAMKGIIKAIEIIRHKNIVLPLHPRTRNLMSRLGLSFPDRVTIIDPIGYLDMLVLEKNAEKIMTDSGGVQKEAYLFKVPCITLRDETEWTETVEIGWNMLVGSNTESIVQAVETFEPVSEWTPFYGTGKSADQLIEVLLKSGSS